MNSGNVLNMSEDQKDIMADGEDLNPVHDTESPQNNIHEPLKDYIDRPIGNPRNPENESRLANLLTMYYDHSSELVPPFIRKHKWPIFSCLIFYKLVKVGFFLMVVIVAIAIIVYATRK